METSPHPLVRTLRVDVIHSMEHEYMKTKKPQYRFKEFWTFCFDHRGLTTDHNVDPNTVVVFRNEEEEEEKIWKEVENVEVQGEVDILLPRRKRTSSVGDGTGN
jgi:hypothetical protein